MPTTPLLVSAQNQMAASTTLFITLAATLLIYITTAYFQGQIFWKAGEERWKAWVPVYNQVTFFRLGNQRPWIPIIATITYFLGAAATILAHAAPLLILLAIPAVIMQVIAGILAVVAAYRIGLHLRHQGSWVLLYILLPLIWTIIFAIDGSMWHDDDELRNRSTTTRGGAVRIAKEIPHSGR